MMTLEDVHEEVCYVIECLTENYTGEAKTTLSELADAIESSFPPTATFKKRLLESIRYAKEDIQANGADAIGVLIIYRHQIRNTIRDLEGRKHAYNNAGSYVDSQG